MKSETILKNAIFLVLSNTHVLDLAGPLQIIASLNELGIAKIAITCVGPQSTVKAFQNVTLSDLHPLPPHLSADTVLFVIGSKMDRLLMRSQAWKEALIWLGGLCGPKQVPDLTICGVCTGTLLLAKSGILDGYLCTTHHRFTQQLRQEHPRVNVLENRICVNDRNIWTSAGVSSGIDLALNVIAEQFGQAAAIQIARENVVNFRRFRADPELHALLRHRSHCNALVHDVQDAISKDLSLRLSIATLANRFNLSARHLSRVFLTETRLTIHQYQTELRIDRALSLLAGSRLSLDRIAEQCGFGSVQALRACWNKAQAQTPTAMRQSNRSTPVARATRSQRPFL